MRPENQPEPERQLNFISLKKSCNFSWFRGTKQHKRSISTSYLFLRQSGTITNSKDEIYSNFPGAGCNSYFKDNVTVQGKPDQTAYIKPDKGSISPDFTANLCCFLILWQFDIFVVSPGHYMDPNVLKSE